MDKLEKGKKYILFGNFPNSSDIEAQFKDKLGIEVVCCLNNVDTTVAMIYNDGSIDHNAIALENSQKIIDKLKEKDNNSTSEIQDLKKEVSYYKKNWSKKLF